MRNYREEAEWTHYTPPNRGAEERSRVRTLYEIRSDPATPYPAPFPEYELNTRYSSRHVDHYRPAATAEQGRGNRGKGPRNQSRSDERLRETICEALTDDPRIDATEISVDVTRGTVVLSGVVSGREQKWFAADLLESIGGVRDVENKLRVARP